MSLSLSPAELTSSHKHPTPNHHSLIKSFIHRPSSTPPYLSSSYCSSLQCLPLIAFIDLCPLPPFPLLFRQYSTPEAETNLILKLRSSLFRINHYRINSSGHVENKGERRGAIWATFSIEICHLSPLNYINSNSQSHKWNDCISS